MPSRKQLSKIRYSRLWHHSPVQKKSNDLTILSGFAHAMGVYSVGCICFYLDAPLSRGLFVVTANGCLEAIELAINFGSQEPGLLKAIFVCEGHRKTVDYRAVLNHL